MDKKKVFIIIVIIIALLLIIRIFKNNKENNSNENVLYTNINYAIDEETGEYIVYDENGEEIVRTTDETILELLDQNPDYDLTIPYTTYEHSKFVGNDD